MVRMNDVQNSLFPVSGAQTVSRREFAELVGLSEAYIRKCMNKGELAETVVEIPGKPSRLDREKALAEWARLHPTDPDDSDGAVAEGGEFRDIRLRRERMREEREQIELEHLRGNYLHVDDVRATFGPMIERSKEKLAGLADRLLPHLPGNPVENLRIIRKVVDEISHELVYVDPKPTKRRRATTTPAQ